MKRSQTLMKPGIEDSRQSTAGVAMQMAGADVDVARGEAVLRSHGFGPQIASARCAGQPLDAASRVGVPPGHRGIAAR